MGAPDADELCRHDGGPPGGALHVMDGHGERVRRRSLGSHGAQDEAGQVAAVDAGPDVPPVAQPALPATAAQGLEADVFVEGGHGVTVVAGCPT